MNLGALPQSTLTGSDVAARKVNIDYDKHLTFSSYKTYLWGNGTAALDPLLDQRIIADIDAQLAAKGWQKVESDSDVLVIYRAATTTETLTDRICNEELACSRLKWVIHATT